ncbi:hypothetical protein ES708_15129 [subsurface metagenome]
MKIAGFIKEPLQVCFTGANIKIPGKKTYYSHGVKFTCPIQIDPKSCKCYEIYKPIEGRNIVVYCWTAQHGYCIKSYTSNGEYISTFSVTELQDWNNVLAVDEFNNVYCVNAQLLFCYDKDGNILFGTSSQSFMSICAGPDGFMYSNEAINWEPYIVKRLTGAPQKIENRKSPVWSQGLIMDQYKNIYMKKSKYGGTAKYLYNSGEAMVLIASNDNINSYHKTLAIVNGVLAIGSRGWYEIKTADLDLFGYINESLDIPTIDKPIGVGSIGNDFIICAYDNAHDYAVLGRYKSDGSKIWETNIGTFAYTTPYQVAAFPF